MCCRVAGAAGKQGTAKAGEAGESTQDSFPAGAAGPPPLLVKVAPNITDNKRSGIPTAIPFAPMLAAGLRALQGRKELEQLVKANDVYMGQHASGTAGPPHIGSEGRVRHHRR